MSLTPISGDYATGKGQLFFKRQGDGHFVELGDTDSVSISVSTENLERFSNAFAARTKAFSAVKQQDFSLKFSAMQLTKTVISLGFLAEQTALTQGSATGSTATFADVAAGQIFRLGAYDVTSVVVTDGEASPVSYARGTHYELDEAAGLIKILAKPAGAGSDIEVTYSKPEILASASRLNLVMGSSPEQSGQLVFRGVNAAGAKIEVDLPNVLLRPSGDFNLIGDDLTKVDFEGDIRVDAGGVPGRIVTLNAVVNA